MLLRIASAMLALAVLQPQGNAELATRMSGRWTVKAPAGDHEAGRGGRRGGGVAYAVAPGAQRGARGGGGNVAEPAPQMPGVTPVEAAAQQALATIQQVPQELTIEATPAHVKFIEPRGDAVFQIDGKSTTVDVPGGTIKVKSRWDRSGLRQEFSSTQRVLHRTWTVDAGGRLLTLKQRLEGIGVNGRETQVSFDRQ